MRNLPRRFETEEKVIDKAVERLQSRIGPGLPLEEIASVDSVLRGDSDRTNPELPAIWVGDGEVSLGRDSTIINSDFWLDLILQSEIRDIEPQRGGKTARRLAALAGDELVRDSNGSMEFTLGLVGVVYDVEVTRSQKGPDMTGVYTHITVCRVKYKARR